MNIDSVNDENAPFNKTISETLRIVNGLMKDPFGKVNKLLLAIIKYHNIEKISSKLNPFKINEQKRFKKMVKFLRDVGKEKILERIEMFKNQDPNLPDDILTNILKSNSKNHLKKQYLII